MKKKFNIEAITNELEGSAFFPSRKPIEPTPPEAAGTLPPPPEAVEPAQIPPPSEAVEPTQPLSIPAVALQPDSTPLPEKGVKQDTKPESEPKPEKPSPKAKPKEQASKKSRAIMPPRRHDAMTSSEEAEMEIYEAVRLSIKEVGKEATTIRLTPEEKQALFDIEYTYKRQGIKTSMNEVARIACNYIVQEYRRNGELSILAKILTYLNA